MLEIASEPGVRGALSHSAALEAWTEARAAAVPFGYVTGRTKFCQYWFKVEAGVLVSLIGGISPNIPVADSVSHLTAATGGPGRHRTAGLDTSQCVKLYQIPILA